MTERDIPRIGGSSRGQFKSIAMASNAAVAKLAAGKVRWVHSYITSDKTFCIDLADNEALVREHSRLAGFPVTKITEAPFVADPMVAAE